jgi:hypothetical protein
MMLLLRSTKCSRRIHGVGTAVRTTPPLLCGGYGVVDDVIVIQSVPNVWLSTVHFQGCGCIHKRNIVVRRFRPAKGIECPMSTKKESTLSFRI